MNWIGKEVSVVGLGRSNLALIRYLTQKGASITARDQKSASALGHVHAELDALGVDFRLGPDYLHQLHTADAVFLTPGMRKDLPQIVEARRRGVLITSEINLFFEECRAPIVGITGSNGKTTTTSLVALLLEAGVIGFTSVATLEPLSLSGSMRFPKGLSSSLSYLVFSWNYSTRRHGSPSSPM